MSKKSITRHYRNQKTGQYAKLSGSPIAIRRIENFEWPRWQKIVVKRVSRREYLKNIVPIGEVVQSIGLVVMYRRNRMKENRAGIVSVGHEVSYFYQ